MWPRRPLFFNYGQFILPKSIIFSFNINSSFYEPGRIGTQPYSDINLFDIGIERYPQAVPVKTAKRGRKDQLCGVQRKDPSPGKYPLHINIVIGPFFKAVGVQVEIDAIGRLAARQYIPQTEHGR